MAIWLWLPQETAQAAHVNHGMLLCAGAASSSVSAPFCAPRLGDGPADSAPRSVGEPGCGPQGKSSAFPAGPAALPLVPPWAAPPFQKVRQRAAVSGRRPVSFLSRSHQADAAQTVTPRFRSGCSAWSRPRGQPRTRARTPPNRAPLPPREHGSSGSWSGLSRFHSELIIATQPEWASRYSRPDCCGRAPVTMAAGPGQRSRIRRRGRRLGRGRGGRAW